MLVKFRNKFLLYCILISIYYSMTISIRSFNILADVFVEPNKQFLDKWYPTIDYQNLKIKNRFDDLIKYIKGDIILLQEVTPYIHSKFRKLLGDKYIVLPLSRHKNFEHITGNLTIIKKNLFKNITHKTIYLGDGIPSNRPRSSVGLTETDDVIIYNIHLDDSSNTIRKRELRQIISTFDNSKKIIIGGDFNSDSPQLHKVLTNLNFNMSISNKKGTYLCEKPMIDYIYTYGFSNSKGYIDNSSKKDCYKKTIEKYGSNHLPVTISVKY